MEVPLNSRKKRERKVGRKRKEEGRKKTVEGKASKMESVVSLEVCGGKRAVKSNPWGPVAPRA